MLLSFKDLTSIEASNFLGVYKSRYRNDLPALQKGLTEKDLVNIWAPWLFGLF